MKLEFHKTPQRSSQFHQKQIFWIRSKMNSIKVHQPTQILKLLVYHEIREKSRVRLNLNQVNIIAVKKLGVARFLKPSKNIETIRSFT